MISMKIARSGHKSILSRLGHIARSGYSPIGFGPDLLIIVGYKSSSELCLLLLCTKCADFK